MNKTILEKDKVHKRLYSIKEASAYLGRSECALREMIWSGKIPSVRFDRRIYIDIKDLDGLIERNKTQVA